MISGEKNLATDGRNFYGAFPRKGEINEVYAGALGIPLCQSAAL